MRAQHNDSQQSPAVVITGSSDDAPVVMFHTVILSLLSPWTPSPQEVQAVAWLAGSQSGLNEPSGQMAVTPPEVKWPGGVTAKSHSKRPYTYAQQVSVMKPS
jgi:hypothetical protein